MKRKKRKSLILLIGMLLSALLISAVSVLAEAQKGSICVQLDKIGTPLQGVKLFCYQVGLPVKENEVITGWKALEEYASLNLDFNDLGDAGKHRETAEKLEAYVNREEISPLLEGETDANGRLCFEELEEGMYLIIQKSGMSVYGTIQPFLINIPYLEEGLLLYDVETQTKGEFPVPPVTETPPEASPTPPVTETPPEVSPTPPVTETPPEVSPTPPVTETPPEVSPTPPVTETPPEVSPTPPVTETPPEVSPTPPVTETPPEPTVTPGNPGTPDTPDTPDKTPPEEYTPDNPTPVKTGDNAPVESLLILALSSLICIGALFRRKRIK